MLKKSNIYISPTTLSNAQNRGQTIKFINISNGKVPMGKIEYSNQTKKDIAILNYEGDTSYERMMGKAMMTGSENAPIDVFKQEIKTDSDGNVIPITPLSKVGIGLTSYHFGDYNISNNRNYRYKIYISSVYSDASRPKVSFVFADIKTYWDKWSITELHSVDDSGKRFYASAKDVWLFNLNLSSGEQQQIINRSEQQTLGTYSKYVQGNNNYMSGSLSCLLGVDVIPAVGYVEKRRHPDTITSNNFSDMLKDWRNMVYSKNPKLLKDKEGQSYIITITNSTNSFVDYANKPMNNISFSWVQIASVDDVTIVDSFDQLKTTIDICKPDSCECSSTCGICDVTVQSDILGILNTPT